MTSDPALRVQMYERPGRRFVLIVLAVTCITFLAAYWRSFQIKPASDDWPIVTEMQRGNLRGVSIFFTESVIRIGYRPLKSLAIWSMENLGGQSIPARMAWVRAMHLAAAIGYALVALLWLRVMPVRRAGTVAAIALMLLHPVLPQAAGSVDGIDTLVSSAMLWLGAWCVYRFRQNTRAALMTTLLCFIIGVGFKENLFALVPLSIVVAWLFWPKNRRLGTLALAVVLGTAALGAIVVRFYVIRGGLEAGQGMLRLDPKQLIENAALFGTGLLFFGDSIWVFLHQWKTVLAIVGVQCSIALLLIMLGIVRRGGVKTWVMFLLIGAAIAAFPTILLYHVSEMYVPPMLLPFTLLSGLAVDGWANAAAPVRTFLLGLCAIALGFSILTIRTKIDGLVDVGQRADDQLRQVLSFVPPGTRDRKIMLLFDVHDLAPKRTYAVFRMGDEILLVHEMTCEWYRPGDGLKLQSRVVDDPKKFDEMSWDLVLLWDSRDRRFTELRNDLPR